MSIIINYQDWNIKLFSFRWYWTWRL